MSRRFDYVRYDEKATTDQARIKLEFQKLESLVDSLENGRAKALVMTKLEEAYMWCGKAIRDEQIERGSQVEDVPERTNE